VYIAWPHLSHTNLVNARFQHGVSHLFWVSLHCMGGLPLGLG
jgi:hypothetical protein